jgi:hypothetical protein
MQQHTVLETASIFHALIGKRGGKSMFPNGLRRSRELKIAASRAIYDFSHARHRSGTITR